LVRYFLKTKKTEILLWTLLMDIKDVNSLLIVGDTTNVSSTEVSLEVFK
jgi:hypothetical protein